MNDVAENKRSIINNNLHKVINYIHQAGISTSIFYAPPSAIGGISGNIDIYENLPQSYSFGIKIDIYKDNLERTIGIYQNDFPYSVLRTINPLLRLGKIIHLIGYIPYYIVNNSGIQIEKNGLLTKVSNIVLWLITVFSGLATIMDSTYLKNLLKNLLGNFSGQNINIGFE